MFSRARIKLTAYYLLILMSISISFSVIIFQLVNADFKRLEKVQNRIQREYNPEFIGPRPPHLTPQELELVGEARNRFILNLIFINLVVLMGAGTAAYFLAGMTLKPIKEMMDEQNRFISDSSHELRTPLTNLRSEIEVTLRNKKLTKDEAVKIIESNLEEVIVLQKLSDELLELVQGKNKIDKINLEKILIGKVIDQALDKTKSMAKIKNIKIENKVKKGYTLADESRLTQLFTILFDNAIKYSDRNGKIQISSVTNKSKIKINLENGGTGIDKEDLPFIFDRFYRGSKSRSEDGHGLGLSIAKKITEEFQGSISAKSENNKTTFILIFPAA